jgi:hypothetical protein
MSNLNFSNTFPTSSKPNIFVLATAIGIVASLVSGILISNFNSQSLPSNAATPNSNSLDIIVGQQNVGSNIELSLCVKTDPTNTNLHISDATSIFQYNPASFTPSPTILSTGNFGGNGVAAASYAPLSWKNVIGTSDKWSMDITYTGGAGTLLTTTPSLVGKVQFAKTGNTTDTVSSFSQEFFSLENTVSPMIANMINYNGICTDFGATVAMSSSSQVSSSSSSTAAFVIGIANPITGAIGSQLGTIMLSGNTFPNNTVATFTPAGATSAIAGTIQNGNFLPNADQIIPTGTSTGPNTGVLRVAGQSVNVQTNFTAAPSVPTTSGNGGTITITTNQNTTTAAVSSSSNSTANPIVNPTTKPAEEITKAVSQTTLQKVPTTVYVDDSGTVRSGGYSSAQIIIVIALLATLSVGTFITIKQANKLKYFDGK